MGSFHRDANSRSPCPQQPSQSRSRWGGVELAAVTAMFIAAMPRAGRFKIAAIADLHRQLAYAPAETRLRQMDAAERLVGDLDPHQNYPQEFVVYRITGYRPEQTEEAVVFAGEALLMDLVNLVQALSAGLRLQPNHAGRRAIELSAVCQRLGVSSKTIQRYRRHGLVCHYISGAGRVKRLACFEDALSRFVEGHRGQLERAAEYSRIGSDGEAALVNQARQMRQSEGVSLNEAARRLALQAGRAHETVRGLLQRHDRGAAHPIFADRKPLSPREVRLLHRAWMWGVDPPELAARLGKTRHAVHRAINRRRRDLLKGVSFSVIELATFNLPDAASIILASAHSSTQGDVPLHADAPQWVGWILEHERDGDEESDTLLAAYNFLKLRARRGIDALREWPTSDALDGIETDLRWATQLRVRLAALAAPAALRRIEQHERRQLTQLPADRILAHLRSAIDVVARVLETADPSREQRLDRLTAFAMERALSAGRAPRHERASVRHAPDAPAIADPFSPLRLWISWLELSPHHRSRIASLPERFASLMISRYGLDHHAPMTIQALARARGESPARIARQLRRARRALRTVASAPPA